MSPRVFSERAGDKVNVLVEKILKKANNIENIQKSQYNLKKLVFILRKYIYVYPLKDYLSDLVALYAKKNVGALPAKTKKTYSSKEIAAAQKLTNHYLNHKKSDTDGWHDLNNKKKRDGKVIDGIIHSHSIYYTGDYNYSDKYQDLVGQAYLLVHEAALDYVKRTEEFLVILPSVSSHQTN